MDEIEILKDENVARVRDLLAALEKGDATGAHEVRRKQLVNKGEFTAAGKYSSERL